MADQQPLLQTIVTSLVERAPNRGVHDIVNSVLSGDHNPDAEIGKGVVAGLAGGVAGALAKAVCEYFFPITAPDPARRQHITIGDAELELDVDTSDLVTGVLIGGTYGAAAELAPEVTGGNGLGLGSALYGVNNAGEIMDHSKVTVKVNEENEGHELLSDLVYGLVVEFVRKEVRARLN